MLSKAVADFNILTSSIFEGRNISRSSPTDAQVEKALKVVDQSTLNFHWNLSDYRMAETYLTIYNAEDIAVKAISKIVVQHPMWDAFFKDIKGCGPLMAAVCIGYFDIHRARYPSSFWKYKSFITLLTHTSMGNTSNLFKSENNKIQSATFGPTPDSVNN